MAQAPTATPTKEEKAEGEGGGATKENNAFTDAP